jgi:hypothetical protein
MSLLQNEIKGLENRIDQIKVRYGLLNSNVQSNILNNLQVVAKNEGKYYFFLFIFRIFNINHINDLSFVCK